MVKETENMVKETLEYLINPKLFVKEGTAEQDCSILADTKERGDNPISVISVEVIEDTIEIKGRN